MKKITLILMLLLAFSFSYGQIIYFDFDGLTGVTTTDNSDFNDDALTISTISRGSGLTPEAEVNGFDASDWDAANIAGAVTNNDYFEFTITPNAGFEFSVTTITLSIGRSANGVSEIALRSSVDGYTANIDGIKPVVDLAGTPEEFTFNVFQANNLVAVTYRLYGYAETAAGTSRLKGSNNDLIIYGSVASTSPVSCTLSDDFTGPTLSGAWTDVGGNSSIVSDQLSIGTGGVSALDYIHQNTSSVYNSTLSTLSNPITWEFNMRQSRANPSGFNATSYGAAFILGGSDSDINNGNGYAVVFGEVGATDDIRLVSYTGGIDANSNLTDIISGGIDFDREYLSIRVIYDPSTNNWELFVRNDGLLFFSNPISLDASDSVGTAINSTYTSSSLDIIAAAWKHNTAASDTANFDNLCIATSFACSLPTATWTSGAWSPGVPDIDTPVIIDDNYDTNTNGGGFSACTLVINTGATLNIADNHFIEVQNELTVNTGATISVQPYGSFIQNNDASVNNISGSITVTKKTAPMNNWYEYTYWSSPVQNETIGNGLFESQYFRRYAFDASQFSDVLAETGNNGVFVAGQDDIDDDYNDWYWVDPSTVMQPGVGYASTHAEAAFVGPGSPPYQFDYTFEGPFNNGVYNVSVDRNDTSTLDFNWNFIGNPYPSAIDVSTFITENMYNATTNPSGVLDGVIYFWSQNTDKAENANGENAFNFTTSDYATHNGTAGTAGGDGLAPNNSIPSGQGFFVSFSDNSPSNPGTVVFNNAMRNLSLSPDNSQFFRGNNSKKNKNTSNNNNKLWINLTSDNGVFNQIAIGYVDGASNDDDGSYFDARKIVAPKTYSALYSTIKNSDKKYVIQGKDINSINEDEIIKLGFSTIINVATIYKLSIAQFEGDFISSNTVYLKDNLLNTLHNLSASDYTFTSEVGEFNDRFEVVFNANALSTEDISIESKRLKIVELENDRVKFTASKAIKTVTIFDLLGRELYNFKGQSNTETYKLSGLNSTIYIAKVVLLNGTTITKKAFKK